MQKIRSALDGLIASRKGLLALIGLITIQVFLLITLVLFTTLPALVSFEFVKDVFVAGFTYDAAIIGAYGAANIGSHYIEKVKKRGR